MRSHPPCFSRSGITLFAASLLGCAHLLAQTPTPPDPTRISFTNRVMPAFEKLGCNAMACHGGMNGKGGLKFSLFGADPDLDCEALTKTAASRYVNRVEPERSLLLLKATGQIPHQGQHPLDRNSPEYKALLTWVAQGALFSTENEPRIVSLKAEPNAQILLPGATGKITLTASFSDGSKRNVTDEAIVTSSDKTVATTSNSTTIKAGEPGEAILVARYLRQADTVRVSVPQALKASFPKLDAANKIDELVYAKLKTLGIPPSDLCSDPEFLRRVYLTVIGILPTPEEAHAFLANPDPAKRAKLIDLLLERDEFADYWALKWGDILRIKSEYPVKLWPKAAETYYRWVRTSIAKNKPYDQFARELLLSAGSNFREGPANFYRALPSRDPQSMAETSALVFMGARIGCARCHAHPTENWNLKDDLGMAAFFAKVGFKSTLEWKEEIVVFKPKGMLRNPLGPQPVKPKLLDGKALDLDKDEDPRVKFSEWLLAPDNPWFKKAVANRVWFWMLGRGIVNEPDDMRPTNPPENPALLDYLANELGTHHYDLKHLYRLILNSRTFQRSSKTNPENARDIAHFSHYPTLRLGAEQLSDAICQVTETSEKFQSIIPEPFTYMPAGCRATQLSDGDIGTPFLELFGRPPRDTPYESERNLDTSIWQELYLINSDALDNKIVGSPRIKRLLTAKKDDEIIEEFYLAALSRPPAPQEKQTAIAYLAAHKSNAVQALSDVVWALLNSKEFLFIR